MYMLHGWWFLSSGGSYPLVFTVYPPTPTIIPTIPSCPSAKSSSQTPPSEARPHGELQVPT